MACRGRRDRTPAASVLCAERLEGDTCKNIYSENSATCGVTGWELENSRKISSFFFKRWLTLSPATRGIHHRMRLSRHCMFQYVTDGWCFPRYCHGNSRTFKRLAWYVRTSKEKRARSLRACVRVCACACCRSANTTRTTRCGDAQSPLRKVYPHCSHHCDLISFT
jgi:hypothetical protein